MSLNRSAAPWSRALAAWSGTGRWARFLRYASSSALATLASAVALAVAYHGLHAAPAIASVAAFLAGAVVNFVANRFWAFRRRGRTGVGRDLIGYAVLALGTAAVAAGATTAMHQYADRVGASPTVHTVLVEVGYFATYAAMFLVKFVVLDRVLFRSRTQVRSTTPA